MDSPFFSDHISGIARCLDNDEDKTLVVGKIYHYSGRNSLCGKREVNGYPASNILVWVDGEPTEYSTEMFQILSLRVHMTPIYGL